MDNDEKQCIICNEDVEIRGRLLPPKTNSIVEKAEPILKEIVEIHINNNNLKYVKDAKPMLLTLFNKIIISSKCSISSRRAP